ncbi:unnamed protein product [Haemonchus placei]|uniref:CUB domain-containing protein n=1 Tax=Haemonchus placei TaxID=6290 RepID=A0A0N4X5A9_HAEPC|nr:unnamed protein product [Haemonchus placei]
MLVCAVIGEPISTSAWLCPYDPADALARIPTSYNCSWIIPPAEETPRALSVHIYRPNTQRYDTVAHLCKVVVQSVTYSVNFFGARYQNSSETHAVVPLESCKLMIQHHKCEHGTLIQSDDFWATSNPLVIQWPTAPLGCCSERTVTVSNCFLVRTVVHMRHGAPFPDSPVGNLAQCTYESGNCVLQDGSVLVWTPSKQESCRFTPIMKMKGRQLGDIWISDSKEFALSWRETSDRVVDCGARLILSDQGYAVAPAIRRPRSTDIDAGIVTSNQLAAQLLAVEGSVGSAVSSLFHHALSALCDRTNLLAFALHTSLAANPTLTLRNLLGRNDIAASSLGSNLVQIHRCMAIPANNFKLIPFNGTCFSKPMVRIVPPSANWSKIINGKNCGLLYQQITFRIFV